MPKVMLVEDDVTMLSLLSTLLEMEGFTVVKTDRQQNADGFVESIRQEAPDLVLLDVNLRQTNGFDVLHALRQDGTLKSIRVLMSSGMDYAMRSYQEGADGFILKPYMPDDLLKKIRQTIGE